MGRGVGFDIRLSIDGTTESKGMHNPPGACGNSGDTGAEVAPKLLPNHTSRSISGSKCGNLPLLPAGGGPEKERPDPCIRAPRESQ